MEAVSGSIAAKAADSGSETRKVIFASSLGTVFEWYDFILFGSLAPIIARQFFTKVDPTTGLVFALLAFSAGFIVRPFGALVFGRLGDVVGRKYTFLMTILIMGLSTFAVGFLPNYDAIGIAAPILLISLRLLQGLAVGGEYGGAVVYVAEHAPSKRRGEFTSWIQTTGTLGFILSLIVVLATRTATGEAAFTEWGWRIPFLLSIILLAISVWVRMAMHESPVFTRMKAAGTISKAPLSEAFGRWGNLKIVLTALFGLVTGFGVVWYATQFYVLLFLTQTLKVDGATANLFVIIALLLATPFFVIFGALSDRIGRKWLVLGGILLAALSFFPVFKGLTHFANPALEKALLGSPVVVKADPADCQFQINVTGTKKFTSSCDQIKAKLVAAGVNYANEAAPAGSVAEVRIGNKVLASFDARGLAKDKADEQNKVLSKDLATALQHAGYPAKAAPEEINKPMVVLLIFVLVFFLAMAYGPVASMLVEMFPTRIRYSSLSLPYHIGTGWVGGLMPTMAFAMVAYQGDIYYGLWFPVVIALVTVAIGSLFIRETKDVDINK
ncbi:MAG: MFS transporter [Candidimonas sp.]|nr:MAG: MFS transporter [Candidimonas sp.]